MPADSDTDTVPGTDIYYTHDIQVRYILYMYSGYYKNVITFKYNESDCFLYSYLGYVCVCVCVYTHIHVYYFY